MSHRLEILTNAEMASVDKAAVSIFGVPSLTLMENAGRAVADSAETMVSGGARIVVICGPGNNGGDGFVAARLLKERGYDVALASLVRPAHLTGDAAAMGARWTGEVSDCDHAFLDASAFQTADLVIDAIFGAGLSRDFDNDTATLVRAVNAHVAPVLSVDVPSGVNGTTGQALVDAIQAENTVTFFRLKPGHLLFPGRRLCGRVTLADISIPDAVLESSPPKTFVNAPELWADVFPNPATMAHKYTRGHAVVVSGRSHATGAARLAAQAALRAGSGLVTVASPRSAVLVNAMHLTAIMLEGFERPDGLRDVISDPRRNAILIGPGCGVGADTRQMVSHVLAGQAAVVLDADALTSFADEPDAVFQMIKLRGGQAATVMTPHDGEFGRLFGSNQSAPSDSKLERAREAARVCGAVVVLKGPDTVIAAPDGRAAINNNAQPWLATAGSGDVLAGIITGLMAQHMGAWQAASAGVWLHGEAATEFGPGLIAEDLPELLPQVLKTFARILFAD